MIDDQSVNSILDGILNDTKPAPAAPVAVPVEPAPVAVPEPVITTVAVPEPVVVPVAAPEPVMPPAFPTPPAAVTTAPIAAPEPVVAPVPVSVPDPTPVAVAPVEPVADPAVPAAGNGPVYEGKGMGKYKVVVIPEKCIGAASCVAVAAKAFKLNDQQIAEVLPTVAQETDDNLLLAAQSCPTLAIEVYDTTTGEKVWPK